MIAIRRPGCTRSSSHFIDASGRFDMHHTDDDRASEALISDDRDHHLPNRDRTAQMFCGRIPRSRFDRDTIVAKINRDHGSFITESSPRASNGIQWRIKITIVARSWVFLKRKLRLIFHEIEATIVINGSSRLHDPSWPSIRLQDRIKRPKNRAIFPFKRMNFSLLFFNF